MFVQKQYARRTVQTTQQSAESATSLHQTSQSRLHVSVQRFVKLIMNVDMMKKQISAMGVNIRKLPLGKLTKSQIARGYAMLAQISKAIEKGQGYRDLIDLSSAFYTLIPHQTAGTTPPPVIEVEGSVKAKLSLLQSLEDLRVGSNLLAEAAVEVKYGDDLRPEIDIIYEKLNCLITPLANDSYERLLIERYVQQTHNDIEDKSFSIKIDEIYSLTAGYESRFEKFAACGNRQLLWHSSRIGNFAGIISQGLRIAPKEAPSSGYRLGKGIYFTDSLHKSSMYCWATSIPSTQCLLLCEVSLGQQRRRYVDDIQASVLEDGYHSIWAVGRRQNDGQGTVFIEPGLLVPNGSETWPALYKHSFFEHNEFVVYDEERVRPRYLLTTTFQRL